MKIFPYVAILLGVVAAPVNAVTFTNATPIVIADNNEVSSAITVAGTAGPITGLTLTLNGLSHTYPDDLVFGLAHIATNTGFVFLSGVGGSTDAVNATVTFSDTAAGFAPESFVDGGLVSGTYLPSNYRGFLFNFFDNVDTFAGFSGSGANGLWQLFVLDAAPDDVGTIAGGWSLDFSLTAVPEPATWGMMIVGFGFAGSALRRRRAGLQPIAA